jgi:pyridoxamine 5'-phosphate oxidase
VRDLTALREQYQRAGLRRADLADSPIEQFETWFDQWMETDPYDGAAMVVATVDPSGHPSARYVLLRTVDERGFVFFTNYESAKGADLAANPRAALTFGWLDLNRQVRVEGHVERVSDQESDAYFSSRPRRSQLAAWASPQSEVIPDRAILDRRFADLESAHEGHDVPRPHNWGGFRVVPETVEFWQGQQDRMHDRFRYRHQAGGGWLIDRLAP